MGNEATFDLIFRTKAQLDGLNQLSNSLNQKLNQLQQFGQRVNTVLGAVGLGLGLRELNEYGKKALEARQQQAAFTQQILRGVDGSHQLVRELERLNTELDRQTGINPEVTRQIEKQLSLFSATGEQIRKLTVGILDFAAARGKEPLEMAELVSRALTGEDIAMGRLGIRLDKNQDRLQQINQLIQELGRTSGAAAALAQASGGMTEFENATHDAMLALGNFVNTIRIPFLTALTGTLGQTKQKLDEVTKAGADAAAVTDTWGYKFAVAASVVGHSVGNILNVVTAVYNTLRALQAAVDILVVAAISAVVQTAEKLVGFAIDKLNGLAKFAATTARALSLGTISIDTTAFDAAANSVKSTVGDVADTVHSRLGAAADEIDKRATDALKRLEDAVANMTAGGPKVLSAEWLEQIKKQYQSLFGAFQFPQAAPGTGVITPAEDQAGKIAAARETVAAATFRVQQAEQAYQIALRETQLLESSGAISAEEARARKIQATREYLAQNEQLQASLRGVIDQLRAAGDTEGVRKLEEQLNQLKIAGLELKISLADMTFFGQIRSQIQQLATEWGNLGKQIGGFFTNTFQTAAASASQALSGLIFRTGDWRQAFAQAAQSIVQNLIQIVFQYVLSQTIMKALAAVFRTGEAAATKGQASAAAAAWAPAATAASIATGGIASATGLTAFLAAIAAGVAGSTAAANVGTFVGHSGGVAGANRRSPSLMAIIQMLTRGQLSSREVLAVLLKGEGVFTEQQMAGMAIKPGHEGKFHPEQRAALSSSSSGPRTSGISGSDLTTPPSTIDFGRGGGGEPTVEVSRDRSGDYVPGAGYPGQPYNPFFDPDPAPAGGGGGRGGGGGGDSGGSGVGGGGGSGTGGGGISWGDFVWSLRNLVAGGVPSMAAEAVNRVGGATNEGRTGLYTNYDDPDYEWRGGLKRAPVAIPYVFDQSKYLNPITGLPYYTGNQILYQNLPFLSKLHTGGIVGGLRRVVGRSLRLLSPLRNTALRAPALRNVAMASMERLSNLAIAEPSYESAYVGGGAGGGDSVIPALGGENLRYMFGMGRLKKPFVITKSRQLAERDSVSRWGAGKVMRELGDSISGPGHSRRNHRRKPCAAHRRRNEKRPQPSTLRPHPSRKRHRISPTPEDRSVTHKPRFQGKIAKLPAEQRQQLHEWFRQNLYYSEIAKLVLTNFGVKIANSSLSTYYSTHSAEIFGNADGETPPGMAREIKLVLHLEIRPVLLAPNSNQGQIE